MYIYKEKRKIIDVKSIISVITLNVNRFNTLIKREIARIV